MITHRAPSSWSPRSWSRSPSPLYFAKNSPQPKSRSVIPNRQSLCVSLWWDNFRLSHDHRVSLKASANLFESPKSHFLDEVSSHRRDWHHPVIAGKKTFFVIIDDVVIFYPTTKVATVKITISSYLLIIPNIKRLWIEDRKHPFSFNCMKSLQILAAGREPQLTLCPFQSDKGRLSLEGLPRGPCLCIVCKTMVVVMVRSSRRPRRSPSPSPSCMRTAFS